MYSMTTAKRTGLRVAVILMMAIFLLPIFASTFAASVSAASPAGEKAVLTAKSTDASDSPVPKKGTDMLGWGVFGIAAGEVFGAIGMGISYSRKKKKRAAADAAAPLLMREKEKYLKAMHDELHQNEKADNNPSATSNGLTGTTTA